MTHKNKVNKVGQSVSGELVTTAAGCALASAVATGTGLASASAKSQWALYCTIKSQSLIEEMAPAVITTTDRVRIKTVRSLHCALCASSPLISVHNDRSHSIDPVLALAQCRAVWRQATWHWQKVTLEETQVS